MNQLNKENVVMALVIFSAVMLAERELDVRGASRNVRLGGVAVVAGLSVPLAHLARNAISDKLVPLEPLDQAKSDKQIKIVASVAVSAVVASYLAAGQKLTATQRGALVGLVAVLAAVAAEQYIE